MVPLTAPLSMWADADMSITTAGVIAFRHGFSRLVERELIERASKYLSSGTADVTLGVEDLYSAIVKVRFQLAADKATQEKSAAERREREAKEKEELSATCKAKEDFLAATRDFASRYPNLQRAATEGYDVSNTVLSILVKELRESVNAVDSAVDTDLWHDPELRCSPNEEAFALLDRATEAVADANDLVPNAIGSWTISKIVRLDVCPHRGEQHNVTAVLATFTPRVGERRQITWSTESMACDHGDE